MQNKITDIKAIKVYDHKGRPTIKVLVFGAKYYASYTVPFLISKDNVVLPVDEAIKRILEIIKPELIGESFIDQFKIDKKLISLDNTPNFSHLGLNSIYGLSLAVTRLSSYEKEELLFKSIGGLSSRIFPIPIVSVLTGNTMFNNGVKEYQIIPLNFESFKEAIFAVSKVQHTLEVLLKEGNYQKYQSEEGVFVTPFKTSCETFEFMIEAIERAGYILGSDFVFGMNIDAESLYNEDDDNYHIDNLKLSCDELMDYYEDIYSHFPILYLENYFKRDDLKSHHELFNRVGHKMILAGDNIYEGSFSKLQSGYLNLLSNSAVFTPGLYGTLSNYLMCLQYSKTLGLIPVFKMSEGESEDNLDADLCLAGNYPFIRISSFKRSDKNSKVNRLIELSSLLDHDEYAYSLIKDKDIIRNCLRNFKYYED